jgi:glutamate dehydrogenase (NADP+)
VFLDAKILYGPGKAANAGGVAVSGLEMAQNSGCLRRSRQEVDQQLQCIMRSIHENCVLYGKNHTATDYVQGANVAAFVKVADAMLQQGVV